MPVDPGLDNECAIFRELREPFETASLIPSQRRSEVMSEELVLLCPEPLELRGLPSWQLQSRAIVGHSDCTKRPHPPSGVAFGIGAARPLFQTVLSVLCLILRGGTCQKFALGTSTRARPTPTN